jgi:hypothetical protein
LQSPTRRFRPYTRYGSNWFKESFIFWLRVGTFCMNLAKIENLGLFFHIVPLYVWKSHFSGQEISKILLPEKKNH